MDVNKVKLIVVLTNSFEIRHASSSAHVDAAGGWPSIALLAGGMWMAKLTERFVEVHEDLREHLLETILIEEHAEPGAQEHGFSSFYDMIKDESESPVLVYLEELDGYEFRVSASEVVPLWPLQVFGEQLKIQAGIDAHVARAGQLRMQQMIAQQKMQQQGPGFVVPGRGGMPAVFPRPPIDDGDGRIKLP